MPKTFRVSVAGGINVVQDTAFSDGKHVAYMENLDVRGGKAVPYQLPLLNPNITVPPESVQVFAYRSRILFSPKRRNYVAEYMDNRERIYWTEYGGNAIEMIDGTQVPLGTTPPALCPGIAVGTYVAPQDIQAIVATGGDLAKGAGVTFRLAYQTAFGVLPPSGIIQPSIPADGSQITLTWANPPLDTQPTQILLFLGTVGGDEKFLLNLEPKVTSFNYASVMTASGALAADYDQSFSYQYASTYTRNVNGVTDESGPSAPSPAVRAASSRKITIDPWAEGILDSPNVVTWAVPFTLADATTLPGYSTDNGATNTIAVDSIVEDHDTGRIIVTFGASHAFYDGQRIFFQGLTPNPFEIIVNTHAGSLVTGTSYTILTPGSTDWVGIGAADNNVGTTFTATGPGFGTGVATYTQNAPVEIEVDSPSIADPSPAPMLTTCYLIVGSAFVAPVLALTGVTAFAVPKVGIASMAYNPQAGTIGVQTVLPSTFNNEKVLFSGFADVGWEGEQIQVMGDPGNVNQFFVDGKAMPYDLNLGVTADTLATGTVYQIVFPGTTNFTLLGAADSNVGTIFTKNSTAGTGTGLATAHFVSLPVTVVAVSGLTKAPIIGDVLYFDFTANGTPLREAHAVKATPTGGFLVNAKLPTGATVYTPGTNVPATAIQFVPDNDYLQFRNIYRAGGTTSFQLVKQLAMDVLTYLDAIPDQGLGQVLPTLFTYNGVDVVVEPAPFGLAGLVRHNGIGFAFDPGSNRVVWTLQGNMNAWVPEFYFDFDTRVLALAPFNQALCVFTESGVIRADGSDPTNLIWSPTKAAPCRAGGSVQFLNNRLLYLSDQGIMAFDGQESVPLTDQQIPGDFWLANSRYLNEAADPGQFLVPPLQNAAYERLRGSDLPGVTPRDLNPYMVSRFTQREGIRSFIKYGKYFLYWGGDYPEFAAQTMICVDFGSPGHPIVSIGVKAVDAFVDERERVHMILRGPVPPPIPPPPPITTVIITVPSAGDRFLPGEEVTYTCIPHTDGYTVGDHTCTWSFEGDDEALVGTTVTHVWDTLGSHTATVTAICDPTEGEASASVAVETYVPWVHDNWLYTLVLDLPLGGPNVAEVQRRNLIDQTNHTFATYAKIPDSIISLLGASNGQNVKDMMGISLHLNGTLYLSVVTSTNGGTPHDNRESVASANMYSLASVDELNMGTWTLLSSDSLPFTRSEGLENPTGSYNAHNEPVQYSYGDYPLGNNTSYIPIYNNGSALSSQTLETYAFMSPCYLASGVVTKLKPIIIENNSPVVHDRVDDQTYIGYHMILVQNFSESISDSMGNSISVAPDSTIYTNSTVFGLVTGSLPVLESITFPLPYAYGNQDQFAIARFPLNTFTGQLCSTGNLKEVTPTSTDQAFVDNHSVTHPLTVPLTNGSDALVGVWGMNGAAIYRKSTSLSLIYDDFYICKVGDYSSKYSIFATLGFDGSVYHIEGPEDVTPVLYKDNTLVMSLN